MKESYTPQLAEYAVASHIDQEPAFAWWVTTCHKKEGSNYIKSKINILVDNT